MPAITPAWAGSERSERRLSHESPTQHLVVRVAAHRDIWGRLRALQFFFAQSQESYCSAQASGLKVCPSGDWWGKVVELNHPFRGALDVPRPVRTHHG